MTDAFGTQGQSITINALKISEVTDISRVGQSSNLIDATHLESTAREYIGGLKDGDEVTIQGNTVSEDAGQNYLRDNIGATAPVVLTKSNGDTRSFDAVILGFGDGAVSVEGKETFDARMKVTGDITFTEAP